MSNNITKKRTVPINFRITKYLDELLIDECQQKKITKSSLLGVICSDFLEKHKYLTELDFIPAKRTQMKMLFRGMTEKNIQKMAEEDGIPLVHDTTSYIFGNMEFDSYLKFFEWYLKTQGHLRINHKEESYKFTLKHNICFEYSLYLAKILENIKSDSEKNIIQVMKCSTNLISFQMGVP